MHKSRLGTLVIDCQGDDLDADADFWSKALGGEVITRHEPGDEIYRALATDPAGPKILIQKVSHPSRVHLDIEADDIEAEVARLERLGARRIEKVRYWWVLEAPTGHRFCVVDRQRADFEGAANIWQDEWSPGDE